MREYLSLVDINNKKKRIERSIIYNNHPSGNPEPSDADIDITRRILETGKIIGIDVLDHIIIADNNSFSFKEKGILL